MSEVSIDQLRISIEAKASEARSSIKGLADDVSRLKGSTGGAQASLGELSSALDGLKSSASSVSTLKSVSDSLSAILGRKLSSSIPKQIAEISAAMGGIGDSSNLKRVSEAVAGLVGVQISPNIGNQLKKISEGMNAVNGSKIDSSKFMHLAQAMRYLSDVPKGSIGSLINSLAKLPPLVRELNTIDLTAFEDQCRRLAKAMGELPAKAEKVSSALRSVSKAPDGATSFPKGSSGGWKWLQDLVGTAAQLGSVWNIARNAANGVIYFIKAANRAVEDTNLFRVALGEGAAEAERFAQKASSVMGINIQDWLRSQGTFATMAKGMGAASDQAMVMSQGLTQLGYDLASFYNLTDAESFEKLRSGLAGELEPLRALGYDLSVARLQQEAYNLGIDESVSSMTQAEKAMLRYYAIMNQITWAHGDMARTLKSPANLMRIFSGEVNNAAKSIGNIFLPAIQAIMPVAIACARVVATLANMLADLTGGTQIASVDYSGAGSGLESMAGAAGDAAGALGDAGKAAGGTGKKAGQAAKKVKELKRQLMGFDEINMFSRREDSGSGSGGGGRGGGGGAGSSIPIQTYDFLGNAKPISDDIYNAIMDLMKRLGKAFEPLIKSFQALGAAIAHQFDGLDIVGAISNALAGFANLLSNFVRQCVEIIGPLIVAFNFPETLAVSLNLFAQTCLFVSAAINGLGSLVKGFTDRALIPLVAWIGEKLRDAMLFVIGVMQTWQDWFIANIDGLNALGKAAGTGAGLVLAIARAMADGAFLVFGTLLSGINAAMQWLLATLVNSEAARVAVGLLGAALAALAIGNGIAKGILAIGNYFEATATKMEEGAKNAKEKIGLLSLDLNGNFALATEKARNGADKLGKQLGIGATRADKLTSAQDRLKVKVANAKSALEGERAKMALLSDVAEQNKGKLNLLGKANQFLATKTQEYKVKAASANVALAENKSKLVASANAARQAANGQNMLSGGIRNGLSSLKQSVTQMGSSTASIVANTAVKGAATAATGAFTVAQGLLNAVVAAFPGMVFAAALSGILGLLQPIVDAVGGFIGGLLGLNDATGDVTETTEQANQVLSEEEQRVKDNIASIEEYKKSHDNLGDALAVAAMDVDKFQEYLSRTGQTMDEVEQKQSSFTQGVINGFSKMGSDTALSLDEMIANLRNNYAIQKQWSEDLQTLMREHGLNSNSALVQGLLEAGPEKVGAALHEAITNPASGKLDELIQLAQESGSLLEPTIAAGIGQTGEVPAQAQKLGDAATAALMDAIDMGKEPTAAKADEAATEAVAQLASHTEESKAAGTGLINSFTAGMTEVQQSAIDAAKAVSTAVVSGFNGGDGYNAALDAGRNIVGGFGDGIMQAAGSVTAKARQVKGDVVKALNGGAGYREALSAGRNLAGGYADGIRQSANLSANNAKSARSQVINSLNGGSGTSAANTAGRQMMRGYADGLRSAVSQATYAAKDASSGAARALASKVGEAAESGRRTMRGYVDGLRGYVDSARRAGADVAGGAASGLSSASNSAWWAGYNLGSGFEDGMWRTSSSIYRAARTIASNAAAIMRRALAIHSPSRVTREIGAYFSLGMAVGIDSEGGSVIKSVKGVVSDALDATDVASRLGQRAGDAFGAGMASGLKGVPTGLISMAEENARRATASFGLTSKPVPSSRHERTDGVPQDVDVKREIASAVAQGVLNVQMVGGSGTAGRGGDSTIVLRVDGEDLARAVAKGQDSLARRGVIEFS